MDPNVTTSLTDSNTVATASLIDVTNARVFTDGNVSLDGDTNFDTTFSALMDTVRTAGGWLRHYDTNGTSPSQRTINRSPLVNGVLFSTAFTPADDVCGENAQGELVALDLFTGTPRPNPILGSIPCGTCPAGVDESVATYDLGAGIPSPASIHVGGDGTSKVGDVTVIVQKSTGAIETDDADVGSRVNSGEMSWREYRDF